MLDTPPSGFWRRARSKPLRHRTAAIGLHSGLGRVAILIISAHTNPSAPISTSIPKAKAVHAILAESLWLDCMLNAKWYSLYSTDSQGRPGAAIPRESRVWNAFQNSDSPPVPATVSGIADQAYSQVLEVCIRCILQNHALLSVRSSSLILDRNW